MLVEVNAAGTKTYSFRSSMSCYYHFKYFFGLKCESGERVLAIALHSYTLLDRASITIVPNTLYIFWLHLFGSGLMYGFMGSAIVDMNLGITLKCRIWNVLDLIFEIRHSFWDENDVV